MPEIQQIDEAAEPPRFRGYWGVMYSPGVMGPCALHRPLPETLTFPAVVRAIPRRDDRLERYSFPPHLIAERTRNGVDICLFAGSGYRAGYDPDRPDDFSTIVDVGGERVPTEWAAAIAAAVEEARALWPSVQITFGTDRQ